MAVASVSIEVLTNKAVGAVNKLKNANRKLTRTFTVLNKRSKGLTGNFNKLQKVLGTVALTAFGQQSISAAANFQKLELRLKLLTEATGTFAESQKIAADAQKLFGISTLEALEGVTNITARLAPLGIGVEDIRTTFIGFNTAAKLAGASTIEATNAFRQLAQALGSGRLQGDEFRSISEQIPTLLKPVADELGTTVGKLKEFSSQGKITSDVVIRALSKIEKQGAPMLKALLENDPTQVFKNLQNATEDFSIAVGESLLPATKTGTVAITGIARIIDILPSSFVSAAVAIGTSILAFTALKGPVVAVKGTLIALGKTITLLTGVAAGPLVAAIAGVSLVVTALTGHIIKLRREKKAFTKLFEDSSSKELQAAIRIREKELKVEETRAKNFRFFKSRNKKKIESLQEEIDLLKNRNKQVKSSEDKDAEDIRKEGELLDVLNFQKHGFPEGSEERKIDEATKKLKQRVQIKQAETEIDARLLENQFEFENSMKEAMSIENDMLRLQRAQALLADFRINRQKILNGELETAVEISKDLGQTLEDSLVENIKGAIKGTKTFGDAMLSVLDRIRDKILDKALSKLFDGFAEKAGGSFIGNFFGKLLGRAGGGSVTKGRSFLVGENGPEVFTPASSGNITSNKELGGTTNITINIDSSGSSREGDDGKMADFATELSSIIQAEIIDQKRSGGLLA